MIGEDSLPVTSYWKDVVRRFCKNKIAVIGSDRPVLSSSYAPGPHYLPATIPW